MKGDPPGLMDACFTPSSVSTPYLVSIGFLSPSNSLQPLLSAEPTVDPDSCRSVSDAASIP